jgi:NADH:ubiquinone oxidoreductase subunit
MTKRGRDKKKRKRRLLIATGLAGAGLIGGSYLFLSRKSKEPTIPGFSKTRKPNIYSGVTPESDLPYRYRPQLHAKGKELKQNNKYIKRGREINGVMVNSQDTMYIPKKFENYHKMFREVKIGKPVNLSKKKTGNKNKYDG